MKKEAFMGAVKKVVDFAKKHPEVTYGAAGAAGLGGLSAGTQHLSNKFVERYGSPLQKENLRTHHLVYHPLTQGAIGAAFGGYGGSRYGAFKRSMGASGGRSRHGFGGEAPSAKVKDTGVPSWLKGVKSKAEAKRVYRAQARSNHPDLGGDAEKMKTINQQWDSFSKHHFDKLSMFLPSFYQELYEIAR